MTDAVEHLQAVDVDEQELATHLRDLADGLESRDVALLSASDGLEADAPGPLKGSLSLEYTVPSNRPELLVALELSDHAVDEKIRGHRETDPDVDDVDPDRATDDEGAPTAEGASIPSSVDPDAPTNSDPTTVRRDRSRDHLPPGEADPEED